MPFFLHRCKYFLLSLSFVLLVVGFAIMSGGSAESPEIFDEKVLFAFTRVKLAPFIILLGYALTAVAIFFKPKQSKSIF